VPTPATAQLTGYRPRSATNDLKEIVEDSMEELFGVWEDRFRERYGPLPERVRTLLERFVRCGDLHFGFLRLRCVNPDCKKRGERLVSFSCKSRHLCPSCGQRRAIQWAERMVEVLLPVVPYRQLVFTIPIALRKAFLFDRSLYGELCRIAYASTRDYLRERARSFPGRSKAAPAMVVSPQSHGDLLTHNPHVHSICSLGLFRSDGVYLSMEDVDFSGLEAVFRERFFSLMLRRQKVRPETLERMRSWEHSGFNVDFARRIDATDRAGLQGLLSYMERAPVSLRRLTYLDDGTVHYQGTKFHPRLNTDHQLLSPVEFLAHLVHHVLLRYEVSSRCYGAISTTFRRKLGWLRDPPVDEPPPELLSPSALPGALPAPSPCLLPCGQTSLLAPTLSPQEEDSEFARGRRRGWAKLISKVWLEDPSLCASCQQPMKIISAINSPEQDDVIERVLRHMKLWDPPWQRQRRARAPPPSTGPPPYQSPDPTIDPIFDDDLYAVDPIWDNDSQT
jgi:hypothetical protein